MEAFHKIETHRLRSAVTICHAFQPGVRRNRCSSGVVLVVEVVVEVIVVVAAVVVAAVALTP